MKCQRCKEREANVQIVQQMPGKKPQTFYLCDICARELGMSIPAFPKSAKFTPNPFAAMSGIFNADLGLGTDINGLMNSEACHHCGLSFEEFQKSGFLGCAGCYETFASRLDPVFLRTQMGKEHVGRKIGRKSLLRSPTKDEENGTDISDDASSVSTMPPASQGVRREKSDAADSKSIGKASKTEAAAAKDAASEPENAEELMDLEQRNLDRLIEEKRAAMQTAVAREDYLLAAGLRDEIAELTKQKEGKNR